MKHLSTQAALKAAKQTKDGRDGEFVVLRTEIQVKYAENTGSSLLFSELQNNIMPYIVYFKQNLKDEAATAMEQLQEAESETKALRSMTQRMILTQEEMVCPLQYKLDL